jgi:hypothetical protein
VTYLHIPHSPDAVEVTQEVANFFVSEARKNTHAAVRARLRLLREHACAYGTKNTHAAVRARLRLLREQG